MGPTSAPPDAGTLEPARALPGGRCPRCGGEGLPPRRQRRPSNPFLSRRKAEPRACADCGLDFEAEPPDTDSGEPPW